MREAISGTVLIKVFLVFLFLYAIFIGVAINYAKAFRIKNRIINIIEQNEGLSNKEIDDIGKTKQSTGVINDIEEYLQQVNYNATVTTEIATKYGSGNNSKCNTQENLGYCITKYVGTVNDNNICPSYYTITTFVRIQIPIISTDLLIPITGETRKVEKVGGC